MLCSNTQVQNGVVECKHRHNLEMVRAFLIQSQLPSYSWVEIACLAIFTMNRLPTRTLGNKSPFEQLFGHTPHYDFLRTFDCECSEFHSFVS